MPTPVSRMRASAWNNSPHISGERPSDGSSSSSSFGADISARPIATICCSPPLMVRASCGPRSARRGNSVLTRARLSGLARARAARIGAELEIFAHRQLGEDAAPFRHQRDAGLDDLVRRQREQVAAVEA